jgi:hypothetical protein
MGTLHIHPLIGSILRFPTQQKINGFPLRGTFFLHARLCVDLHCRADFGVPHQLLHYLHIVAGCSQQRTVGAPKGVYRLPN